MIASTPSSLRLKPRQIIPITVLLRLNQTLKKSIFSRRFYQEINDKVLASTSTLDSTLYFICYFTLLLSSVLNNKPRITAFAKRQRAHLVQILSRFYPQLSRKDSHFRFGTSAARPDIVQDTEVSEKNITNAENIDETTKTSALAVHLKAVSSYISDVRIFNRLVEAIKYMPWIIDEFSALTSTALVVPRLDRLVNFAQAINCLILELLENAGWLSEHNWIGTNDNNYWCIETYIWSSRVWGAYIAVEILELFRRYPSSKRDKNWKINLFTQAVQLPLVLHWSLYDGCLTPFWVGLCGSGASWFGFKRVMDSINLL